jgi:hypothetical protein
MPPLHVVREKYLWPNFVVSVWLLIGLGVFDFVWNVAHWQIFTARPYKPSNAIEATARGSWRVRLVG